MTVRHPPNDQQAEAVLLSTILGYPETLDVVQDKLKPADFWPSRHQLIFEAMLSLREASEPIELTTIAGRLRDAGQFERAGGTLYLSELSLETPVTTQVKSYVERITLLSARRRMIETAQRIAAEGYGDIGDANAWLSECEQRVFEAVSGRAQEDTTVLFADSLREVFQAIQNADAGKNEHAITTGITDLDAMLGDLRRGEVTVIGAHSGIGKSALATCIAVNAAIAGHGVLAFSLEMRHQELTQRILFSEARVDSAKIKRKEKLDADEWRALAGVAAQRSALKLWVDDRCDLEPLQLRSKVRRVAADARRAGVRLGLVIVDYLQLLNGRGLVTKNSNREQEVSAVSRALKKLAKEGDVAVVVLAQLNADNEKRKGDAKPRLGDLRESKGIAQNADNVVLVYNPNALVRTQEYRDGKRVSKPLAPEVVDLIVAKQRAGVTGTCRVMFWPSFTLFSDLQGNRNCDAEAAE